MFFGKTTFAEDSFASQGINDVSVSLTGINLSTAIGTESALTNVTATPTGIAVSSTQASVTVFLPDVTATPSGQAIAIQNIGAYSVEAGGETSIIVGSENLLNTSVGTSSIRTDVVNQPSGVALTSAIGTATAFPVTIATPTGISMSVNISTPGVIAWSPVTPNITNTWTGVDDSNTNIWTEVDDREVA